MTAKGYRYYEVDSFPAWEIGSEIETRHQKALLVDLADDEPRTIIKAKGLADHPDFSKYHVMHETYQKVKGRYRNKPIRGYIAQIEFYIYYHSTAKRMFVDTTREICKEMVDRLEKSTESFLVIPRNIDLTKLANDLKPKVRGGWFGNLQVANVSTIGIFGPTVGESTEWDRYEQMGNLSTLDLELVIEDQRLPVKITRDRGIVLFGVFSESEALQCVLDIQKVLDTYVVQE